MEENGNFLHLSGVLTDNPVYGHEVFGEKFYYATLSVPRLSGAEDLLPITVSERLMDDTPLTIGSKLALDGQLRSYNKVIEGAGRLLITGFAQHLVDPDSDENPNQVQLTGALCKLPSYRHDPLRPRNRRPDAGGQPRLWQERLYPLHHLGPHRALRQPPEGGRQGDAAGALPVPRVPKAAA